MYVDQYKQNPPFFTQVLGWSQVGKTVFLSALTMMLDMMSNVWPQYSPLAATEATQRYVQQINEYYQTGEMPPPTPLGEQEVYVMILRNMERWGGRTLVTRDCAGEIFDNLEIPIEQAPFLLNAPTTFMLVSLSDMLQSGGKSINMLMENYITTLKKHRVNLKKEPRKLVVVLTKADRMLDELPANLRNYLIDDPLWAAVKTHSTQQMDSRAMAEYMEIMGRVSDAISEWIQQRDPRGKVFVRLAQSENIEMRFSLISSTGSDVGEDGVLPVAMEPRRVLDPYFWALELQSK
jgi:hypothetical protein